jgi:hypothetical protein
MSLNLYLPFISTLIMGIFSFSVLSRYVKTKKLQNLFWGIGLFMFGVGSFAEAYLAIAWNRWVFFAWYLCGAILTAAWIGQGSLYLLVRKKWPHYASVILIIGSLFATSLLLKAMPTLREDIYDTSIPVSEQYGTKIIDEDTLIPEHAVVQSIEYKGETVDAIIGLLPKGTPVRLSTPLFNIYGLITLVGGAIWSAYLFTKKQVLQDRVISNVLIAAGALLIASASTLTRLGYGQFLYIGELVSAILMFWGFRIAAKSGKEA